MRYIDSWLTGLGLEYIIPKLKANGITTPKKLAQLTLRDMYEVVGVEDTEDRKKLYFLIQRLHTILSSKTDQSGVKDVEDDENSDPAPPPDMPSPTQKKNIRVPPVINEELTKSTGTDRSSEDDLRVLRKNRRTSMDNSMLSAQSKPRPGTAGSSITDGAKDAVLKNRRSSHIPQIEMQRSSSSELAPPAAPATSVGPITSNGSFRGPVSVPTGSFARRLSLNPSAKETANAASSNRSSPSNASSAPSPTGDGPSPVSSIPVIRSTKSQVPQASTTAAAAAESKSKIAVKAQQDKQALLLQKQKQLAEEEEALLKLKQNSTKVVAPKSIRANPVPVKAATPSPPASPPRAPPPPLQPQAVKPGSSRGVADTTKPSTSNRERDRSPPPPYESIPAEKPAAPVPAPVPAAKKVPVPTNSRNSYPPTAPRVEYSPPQASSETEDDRYTDDSYDYHDASSFGDIDDGRSDEIVDMAIRVVVRKRPISKKELANGDRDVMEVGRRGRVLIHEPKTKVDLTKIIETQEFRFDDAFEAHETNELIYARTIKHLVSFVFEGGKASCFAYGQTGSGKTFSMMGSRPDAPAEAKVNAGLYVLAARDIFTMVKEPQYRRLRVFVSCFEIYGGKLFDLLNERSVVKCLEDAKQQVQLPGLTEHLVKDVNELLDLMAQAHLQRSTGTTGANSESSRSHQVMQIVLREPEPTAQANQRMRGRPNISIVAPAASGNQGATCGKLSFIDLAGSERGADTTHNSKQTRMEGAEINTSLLALKEVIRSLAREHGHTPFRGSKLTQVLKDSFVGDKTRTCMVACVSPSHSNCEHTLNTLRYADRVKEHQSSNSGNPTGAAHVSSSNYDSLAYDSNPRPQTASAVPSSNNPGVAAGNGAAKSRPNTGNSRPATAASSGPSNAQNNRRGADSSRDASEDSRAERPSTANNRQVNNPTPPKAIPKPTSRLPVAAAGSGRSASVSTAQSRQQVPASPGRLVSKGGIPVRQMSAPRGALLSPPASQQASAGISSPPSQKLQRQHSSPAGLSADKVKAAAESRKAAVAGAASQQSQLSRRSSGVGLTSGAGGAGPAARSEKDEQDSLWEEEQLQVNDNPMNAKRQSFSRQSQGSASAGAGAQSDSSLDDIEMSYTRENDDPFDSTELIQKTVGLLSAHKLAIAEMVEVMKDEMELVQQMENVDDRDSEHYIDQLERILSAKSQAIGSLQDELSSFQHYRAAMC